MKTPLFYQLREGQKLLLKSERSQAYGILPQVTFSHIKERPGYSTPWISGIDSNGMAGFFKPSDFAKLG